MFVQCQCMYFEAEASVLALKQRGEIVVPPVDRPNADGPAPGGDGGGGGGGGVDNDGNPVPASAEGQPGTPERQGSGPAQVRAAADTVAELQRTASQGFIRGMERAIDCHKPWAVINGAVYCWNAYLPAMQQGWCVVLCFVASFHHWLGSHSLK